MKFNIYYSDFQNVSHSLDGVEERDDMMAP